MRRPAAAAARPGAPIAPIVLLAVSAMVALGALAAPGRVAAAGAAGATGAAAATAVAPGGCAESYRRAARLQGEARPLWILYTPGPLGGAAEVVRLLAALAGHFGPADVRVGIAAAAPAGVTDLPLVHDLGPAGCPPDRIEVRGPAGELLYDCGVEEADLYEAQLALHRHLHPDSACTYLGQVEALLRRHDAELPAGATDLLFLPPGCSSCQLRRHAGRLEGLLRERPRLAVAAFSGDAAEALAPLGWRGELCVLPATPGSLVLSLRSRGIYLPVVGRRSGPGRYELRTVAEPDTSPPAAPRVHELSPRAVIEGAGYLGEPVDIEHRDGAIYVLDAAERVIWILDERGGRRRALSRPGKERFGDPLDLFFGCDGRLYVTDVRARTIHELSGDRWRSLDLGHRPFHGAGCEGFVVTNSRRDAGEALVDRFACGASLPDHLGARFATGHPLASADNNANYTLLATDGEVVAVGHIALGLIQILGAGGETRARFVVDTPEARELRAWYLGAGTGPEGSGVAGPAAADPLQERLTLALTLADLRAKAAPDRFTVPVYLADIQLWGGRVLVLTNGVLDSYDRHGRLLARHRLTGLHEGEPVFVHDFVVTADGRLLGLDAAHYRKIYDFGPLPGD